MDKDNNLVPNKKIDTKELFGITCKFNVFGFSSKQEHVPDIDPEYKFDQRLQWQFLQVLQIIEES